MMGQAVGICLVSANPTKTTYLFGKNEEITGKKLKVIERNRWGDCLCLDHTGSNLVDINHEDVATFLPL